MLFCPKCTEELHIANRQGIEIDYCKTCRGVWLDGGELEKIIERTIQTEMHHHSDDGYDDHHYKEKHKKYDKDKYYEKKYKKKYKKKHVLKEIFDFFD